MTTIKNILKKVTQINQNEETRQQWLRIKLSAIKAGSRILDAGAGELKNKPLCSHLNYVSQDICKYEGSGDQKGLQTQTWNTSQIDIISDIVDIPEPDCAFDVILCSEVLEHIPNPLNALKEFSRLLKPGGQLILTAPFSSLVHFSPYHYATGFSRYWYELHLPDLNFKIEELTPNGDWFSLLKQEILRLPIMARKYGDWCWPIAAIAIVPAFLYFMLRGNSSTSSDTGCLGWHCSALKRDRKGGKTNA